MPGVKDWEAWMDRLNRTILPYKESYDDWGKGVHATTPGTRKSRRSTRLSYYVY